MYHAVSRWALFGFPAFFFGPGIRTLMARVRDAVVQRVRREEAQLYFDGRNGMDGMGFADGVGADFAEADAGDLALFEQFG